MRLPASRRGPLLVAAVLALILAVPALAARPPLPAGAKQLSPGQVPHVCTQADPPGWSAYGPTSGYYWSPRAKTWVSAPLCYPRWGNLEASPSQVGRAGGTASVAAIPTEGSNSATYAPETKTISWDFAGATAAAGCGNTDLTCTIRLPKAGTEWQWVLVHVTMPRTFFIDSKGSNCAGQHICAGFATNAWSYVGVPPRTGDHTIRGTVRELDCGAAACSRRGLGGVTVTATGGPGGARSASTDARGGYEIGVDKGTWKVRPAAGGRRFTPGVEVVKVSGNVGGIDFDTCARRKQENAGGGVVCDPDGIDWSMPERLPRQVQAWRESGLPREHSYPKQWRVNLHLTSRGKRLARCPKGDRWSWDVDPPKGARVLKRPADGCTTHMVVSDLGTYRVSAVNRRSDGAVDRIAPTKVVAKDWLIVGIGDSNGSGEGNPPFKVRRCARGLTSYQFQVADHIEQMDDHASVTFVFTACSGASVAHLVNTPYRGTVADAAHPLDPQVEDVAFSIVGLPDANGAFQRDREVDALLVSIGVNDLSFGPVLETCVKFGVADFATTVVAPEVPVSVPVSCQSVLIRDRFDRRNGVHEFDYPVTSGRLLGDVVDEFQKALPGRYAALKPAFTRSPRGAHGGLGMTDMKRVYFTQYPDFAGGDDGGPCNTFLAGSIPQWRPTTWQWLRDQSLELNRNVARGAGSIGANTVVIPGDLWQRHGYCATDRWFVPVGQAVAKGDATGPFHPNVTGHTIEAQFNAKAVCRRLLGREDCRGDGEKRPGAKPFTAP